MALRLLLAVLLLISCTPCVDAQNNMPVIGILCEYTTHGNLGNLGEYFIMSAYVNFIKQAGARVVPILLEQEEEYYTELLQKVNGVLIPGGSNKLAHSTFSQAAHIIYRLAVQANDQGTYFPLWGTCLGLQEIISCAAGTPNLKSWCNSKNYTFNLQFEIEPTESRLLHDMPEDLISGLQTSSLASYSNYFCFKQETMQNNPSLNSFFKVLATSPSPMGGRCTSIAEGRDYPFYGSQWHPEIPSWLWHDDKVINYSLEAVRVGQYMANFFVNEARKNYQSFGTAHELYDALIDRQNPVYIGEPLENYFYFYFQSSK